MVTINTKKINDVEVEPMVLPKQPTDILGCKLFPELNNNIFLCAPKKSGKTTTINKILAECANKKTHVIIFCGTIHNDPSWKVILESLDKRKIKHSEYTSIFTDNGVNIIDALISNLSAPPVVYEGKQVPILKFSDEQNDPPKKPKKKKPVAPDYIIIFDDLSAELKNPAIPKLMKIQRHFSSKIIISSQSYIDADPKVRKGNLDYLLLFKNIPEPVLEQIHEEQSIPIEYNLFKELYLHATAEPFHFLYIDRNGVYRKDFNKQYEI